MVNVRGYVDRHDFIADRCRGCDVLDIGVVLAPQRSMEARREFFSRSLHMRIAGVATSLAGIDIIEDEVAQLQALFPDLRLYSGDVEHLSEVLPAHQYDVIVLGDVIEHLSNPGRALDEIRRFLAPGGRLYITCPNAFGLPNYLRFLTGRFRDSPDHVHAYTKHTMVNMLARHSLECAGVWTGLDLRPRGTWRTLLYRGGIRMLSRFPEVGGTLIFEAQHHTGAPVEPGGPDPIAARTPELLTSDRHGC